MASSSSSKPPPGPPSPPKKKKLDVHEKSTATTAPPNWLELPREVSAKILHKVGAMDVMMSAEHVCTVWRNICMDPLMWRTVDARTCTTFRYLHRNDLGVMCRRAIDRSCGHLEDIHLEHFATDDLLYSTTELIDDVGRCCTRLRSLKFNTEAYPRISLGYDDEAFAIAKNMPNLQHLQLIGNRLTNAGLHAILDGCPLLESLDLRGSLNVSLQGSLGRRCAEQIKQLRLPNEHIDDEVYYGDPYENVYYECDCDCGDTPDRVVVDEDELYASRVAEELGLW